jgi:DNA-binding beta-propeller fold protein YncE
VGHPQVAAFARTANGGAKPTRSIAGQNTLFTRTMHDMGYDHVADEIVVPQFFAFAILTFDGGAHGNVPPKRIIMGPKTQINNPHAVTVDPVHGEYFVPGRADDHRVLVFKREVAGDVAPIRIIKTPHEPARVGVDTKNKLVIVSGDDQLLIFDRLADGDDKPVRVITIPKSEGNRSTGLMAVDSDTGMIFVASGASGRYEADDYVAVYSVFDNGEVPPRFAIGEGTLKDIRGVALDVRNRNVIVTDKTLNAILTFNAPEAFAR